MIYSFKINKDFFIKLRDDLKEPDVKYIVNFFAEFLLNRENLLYFDKRDLVSDTDICTGVNSLLIKTLQSILEKKIKPIEILRDTEVDFIFTTKTDWQSKIKKISIDDIIESRLDVTNSIRKLTPGKWITNKKIPQEKLKQDLNGTLKKIFKYSDKVFIVDAYLADYLMQGIEKHVQSFNNSFILFRDLCAKVKTIEFYNGVTSRQLKLRKCNKKNLELKLMNFYKIYKSSKALVNVKHGEASQKLPLRAMYQRMFITFLDDQNIGIFTAERGLNIIQADNNTTQDRMIKRLNNDETELRLELWENMDKYPNFIEFNTGNIK